METIVYKIRIQANIEKVWAILWDKDTYPKWTHHFTPDSQMKTDWKIGGKTYFLDANNEGMVSTISSLEIPTQIVFRHLGMYKDGVEDTKSAEVIAWSGAEEKYFLSILNEEETEVKVIIHIDKNHKEFMDNAFHKGLVILKNMCEV